MKLWIAVVFATFIAGASAQCGQCSSMKWATCDGDACQCTFLTDLGKTNINCNSMVPKCLLMKAEMYRAKKGQDTRTVGGKPVETAFVDNDGIYNPVCNVDGTFKAKQCNDTEQCWCVNSAGVRRSDKGDQNIACDKLVETYWVRLQLKYAQNVSLLSTDPQTLTVAIQNAINTRYDNFNKALVKEVQHDPDARLIVVDVKKDIGERQSDLSRMAYYMEKDIKKTPLFTNQAKFAPTVGSQTIYIEDILVYYVDEEAPTFTMQKLTGGIIAVIVVVILAVVAGLLVVFFARKQQQKKYAKAEPREMEAM